eukprot:6484552-Amphidinium_carterae.1
MVICTRALPRCIHELPAQLAAESLVACAAINVEPLMVYHRTRGERSPASSKSFCVYSPNRNDYITDCILERSTKGYN